LCTTVVSLCLGLGAGLIGGYFGGKTDTALTILTDLFLAFPSLLLAIGISVLMPPGLLSVIVALCVVGWASFARLFRGIVYSVKEKDFVDAARSVGCSSGRIIFFHILPHCLPVALIAASLKVGSFILAESALSFLGLGIQPPEPTLGAMVSLNRNYLPAAPWMVLFPGATIALIVFLCNLVGDGLRDFLDPSLKV
jgi:peptide/nickel transport system permease protein